ncbi:MAG TPA: chemotaxis protein CheD [Candidatus Omnitrophota bacterium]|nr:chemotaxis protein CheD [Candidatus Omnitrophota bacterium]HPS20113.1 chemotaxis protein CheD [Candidatus Omnitrophota bacterium]
MDAAKDLVVGIADIKVGKSPDSIRTSLGSCIAVCLYDSERKIGGMLHLMLAHVPADVSDENVKKAKFADTGIPELIRQLNRTYGVKPSDVTAKIFGGAKVLKNVMHNIGYDNEVAVREILKQNGIRIMVARTGGDKGYNIRFELENGKVKCQVFGEEPKEY